MGRLLIPLFLAIFAATLLLGPPSAQAQTQSMAGLKVKLHGDLTDSLKEELRQTLNETIADSPRFEWIGFRQARQTLPPVARDCFTAKCLIQAGEILDAQVGLAIELEEDTGIYEWTFLFYDLLRGVTLLEERGICELCGRKEVVQQFHTSLQASLDALPAQDEDSAGPIDTTVERAPEGTVVLRVATYPEDTRIFIDDEPAGIGHTDIHLRPGTYELRLSHDTHHGIRETLIISESSPQLVILRAHLSGARSEQRTVLTRGDGAVDLIEPHRKLIGASALGAGAVLTIVGAITASRHGKSACSSSTAFVDCPQIYRTAGLGTSLTILGAISLTGGAALLAWPWIAGIQKEEPYSGSSLQVGISPTNISIFGRF